METLSDLFHYDPQTGVLTNKVDRKGTAKAGMEAGFDNGNGYRRVSIWGKKFYTHQIAWALVYGYMPTSNEIDHADGDGKNNRLVNLRLADRFRNTQNTKKRAHSSQPFKGVRQNKSSGRWEARITAFKRHSHIGTFDSPEEAHTAYVAEANRLHKEFARAA